MDDGRDRESALGGAWTVAAAVKYFERCVRLCGVVLGFVLAVGLSSGEANADVWPYPAGTSEPDRGVHTYCFRNTDPPNSLVRERITWSMGNLSDQTIVDNEFHQTCQEATDVRWSQRFIADDTFGSTRCVIISSNNRCDRYRAIVAYGEIQDEADDPPPQVRKTACHELGHTVGLAHYGNGDPYANPPDGAGSHSCMRSGLFDGGQNWTKVYGAHHVGHVNSNW